MGGIAGALGGLLASGVKAGAHKVAGMVGKKAAAAAASGAKGAAADAAKTTTTDGAKTDGSQKQPAEKGMEPYKAGRLDAPVPVPSMKKGGPVKRTGLYRLHAGEYVVPPKSRSAKGHAGKKAAGRKQTQIKP